MRLKCSPQELDGALASCMKCGFCKAVCPVFIGEETTSPRAKVRLARAFAREELDLTSGVKTQMARCLNCRACADECPSGVEPNKIALAMRTTLAERNGLSPIKSAIFSSLLHPRLMALGTRMMGVGQQITAIDLQNNPLRALLPLVGMRRDKDLPVMGRRSLMSRLPERMEPLGEHRATVLFYPGCATNLIYPETGVAAVNVMRRLGARVILPHDLVCCSTPVFNSGDVPRALELAKRNLAIFGRHEYDYIITVCGSCGLTIGQEWTEALGIAEAEALADRVLDITQFVTRFASDGDIVPLEMDETVTYHDPCHLRRGMRVYREPRELLRAVLGTKFVEMEAADRCCGGGGAFSVYLPDLSQTVAEVKMRMIVESGADSVASGCPACSMQLQDSFVHRGMSQKTVHTVEIIERALRAGESRGG